MRNICYSLPLFIERQGENRTKNGERDCRMCNLKLLKMDCRTFFPKATSETAAAVLRLSAKVVVISFELPAICSEAFYKKYLKG